MRVAITYVLVSWSIIQVAEILFGAFEIPPWGLQYVVIALAVTFPVTIILAWAFELTPDGIKMTTVARRENVDTGKAKAYSKKGNWFAIGFAAALPTVIFGTLALVLYFQLGDDSAADAWGKSIAVLPLENLSPDPDNAFFADGVQEDILTNLSRIDEIDLVISRTSTLRYRNPDRNLKQIGEELGVRYIVEGSVRRVGDQVRVTIQLIDSKTDNHLWAENYNRRLKDTFAIQTEVAKEIAGKLQAILSPKDLSEIEYRPTENPLAYDYFVKARDGEVTGINIREQISLYERAVAHDPDFAEAWARLAGHRIYIWNRENRQDPELYGKAHEALEQAKLLGADLADLPSTLSTFAYRENQDIEAAIDYQLQALAIDPNIHLGHTLLGNRYREIGQLAEAQHHREAALRVDPLIPHNNYSLAETYICRRMWDEAIALIEKNEASSNNEVWSWRLARARYLQTGDRNAYIKAIELQPGYLDNSIAQFRRSLYARDYPNAILHLSDLELEGWVDESKSVSPDRVFNNWRVSEHLQLLAALLHFVQGDNDNWLTEAENARLYFEERRKNPRGSPDNWSRLSICYALEADTDRMKSMIALAREKALHPYYKYSRQAQVEIHIAICYLVLGDHDKAIETLEAASKMDSFIFLNRELDLWFIFDRLRGNPRFDALLED